METLLRYNQNIINYIENNFSDFDFSLGQNWSNSTIIKNRDFTSIPDDLYSDLPNLIALIRIKFRNEDTHGAKVIKKDELEELRRILLFGKKVLVKIVSV